MRVNHKSLNKQFTTVADVSSTVNSKPSNISSQKIQSRKQALSMIWVEDGNGKLTAQWTLQD